MSSYRQYRGSVSNHRPSNPPSKTRPDNTRARLNSGYPPWKGPTEKGKKQKICRCSTYMDYLHRLGEQFLYSRGNLGIYIVPTIVHGASVFFCLFFKLKLSKQKKKSWGVLLHVFCCFGENPHAFWGKYILYLPPLPSGRVLKVYPQVPVETNWHINSLNPAWRNFFASLRLPF